MSIVNPNPPVPTIPEGSVWMGQGLLWDKANHLVTINYGSKSAQRVPEAQYFASLAPQGAVQPPSPPQITPVSATPVGQGVVQAPEGVQGVVGKVSQVAATKAGLIAASVSIGVAVHPLAGLALFWAGMSAPDQKAG